MTDYMGDMANPGTLAIKEEVAAFYIGGDTPHVWTETQIKTQTARYLHPIWVYNPTRPGTDNGIIDAHHAVQQCKALGIPSGVSISFDMEEHVDKAYLEGARSVVAPTGYWTSVYGSKSTIAENPVFGGGRWVADWTGSAHLSGIDREWACQWQKANAPGNPNPWDISVVKDTSHLWDVQGIDPEWAVLVQLPAGTTKMVKSLNGGKTWA